MIQFLRWLSFNFFFSVYWKILLKKTVLFQSFKWSKFTFFFISLLYIPAVFSSEMVPASVHRDTNLSYSSINSKSKSVCLGFFFWWFICLFVVIHINYLGESNKITCATEIWPDTWSVNEISSLKSSLKEENENK